MATNAQTIPPHAYRKLTRNPARAAKKVYPTVCDLFGHRFNLRDYSKPGKVFSICTVCDHSIPLHS